MTEEEWCKGASPKPLLSFISRKATARTSNKRKLRLFSCACVMRLTSILNDDRLWKVVSSVERAADVENPEALIRDCREVMTKVTTPESGNDESTWRICRDAVQALTIPHANGTAKLAAEKAKVASGCHAWMLAQPEGQPKIHGGALSDPRIKPLSVALHRAWEIERAAQARLLRDLFGNPFRPVTFNRSWLTHTVTNLAAAIYEERQLLSGLFDNQRMAVLADALEEAGCNDASVLGHLRGGGDHVRGCWAVDLLAGKE
jgi:hypothetical protein